MDEEDDDLREQVELNTAELERLQAELSVLRVRFDERKDLEAEFERLAAEQLALRELHESLWEAQKQWMEQSRQSRRDIEGLTAMLGEVLDRINVDRDEFMEGLDRLRGEGDE